MIRQKLKKLYHPIAVLTWLSCFVTPFSAGANNASDWDSTEFTAVRIIAASDSVGNTDRIRLGLQFRMEPGWKIYWRSPGDAGSPPALDLTNSRNVRDFSFYWPAPQRFLEAGNLETVGYLDGVVFPINVSLEVAGKETFIHGIIDYQACKTICIPIKASVKLTLPQGPGKPSTYVQLIDKYLAKVPVRLTDRSITIEEGSLFGGVLRQELILGLRMDREFDDPILFVEGPSDFRFNKETKRLSDHSHKVVFRVPVASLSDATLDNEALMVTLVDKKVAVEFPIWIDETWYTNERVNFALLASILGIALLGGLILNLMPCVLPVLAIKVLGVVQHGGGDSRQVRMSFLSSACGILFSFLLLGIGAIALKATGTAVGWGMQFQEPKFLIFLTLVLTIFASNLLGFFEIPIPAWVAKQATPKKNPQFAGSFWTGALATLLATPCSAPFLGTAVGFALTSGPIEIISIFSVLGIGMAIPYLLLAAVPSFATRLPRPGAWMAKVRAVLAVALLGTAIWLLSIIAAQIGSLGGGLLTGLMLVCFLIFWISAEKDTVRATVTTITVLVASVVSFTIPQLVSGQNLAVNSSRVGQGSWKQLDVSVIEKLVNKGNVVFVDITADWCLTCKVNKALVLDKKKVVEQLKKPGVILMQGDWTRPDREISEYLLNFGRYGIPFDAIYGPGAPNGIVLPELLSVSSLLTTLQEASAIAEEDAKQ